MGQLLEGAVSGKAALIYDLADDLPSVEADIAQLSQVVMNLITNAAEAVREGAGRITLRTGIVEAEKVDRRYVVGDFEPTAGSYVFFEVVDDGCGMDVETQSKIFDPFFTTKFTGRGLGLAAALGIVRSHDGFIEIDSEVGRGTRFRVLFPAVERAAVAADYVGDADRRLARQRNGAGRGRRRRRARTVGRHASPSWAQRAAGARRSRGGGPLPAPLG